MSTSRPLTPGLLSTLTLTLILTLDYLRTVTVKSDPGHNPDSCYRPGATTPNPDPNFNNSANLPNPKPNPKPHPNPNPNPNVLTLTLTLALPFQAKGYKLVPFWGGAKVGTRVGSVHSLAS